MQFLSSNEVFQEACKSLLKWGMLINFTNFHLDLAEVQKAAPYLKSEGYALPIPLIFDGGGHLFFDTEEEMNEAFGQTVGDDGPTKSNPYDGPARVYTLTCSPEGKLLSENT